MPNLLDPRPDALLFDIDGTLVDTMPLHFRAWTEALAANGLSFVSWESFSDLGGTSAPELINRLSDEQGREADHDAILRHKMDIVLAGVDEVRPIQAAVDLALDHLDANIPLALVTGGRREAVERSLGQSGLERLANLLTITPAELPPGRGKPHPDGILLACQQLGVDPARCTYVGDSPLDRQAAESAGLSFLHVDELISSAARH